MCIARHWYHKLSVRLSVTLRYFGRKNRHIIGWVTSKKNHTVISIQSSLEPQHKDVSRPIKSHAFDLTLTHSSFVRSRSQSGDLKSHAFVSSRVVTRFPHWSTNSTIHLKVLFLLQKKVTQNCYQQMRFLAGLTMPQNGSAGRALLPGPVKEGARSPNVT